MATETLQFEKQAVDTAQKELQQAQKDFDKQLNTYTTVANKVISQISDYISRRRFWLQ